MRYCLALDLKEDPVLIQEYEQYHRRIWPEIAAHLRQHGVTGMEIYRLGTRLVMLMETDDAVYRPERMAHAAKVNPKVQEWEALMWQFQAATPWTAAGEKWVPMTQIFNLSQQD
ncbi:L-fucose mutarotase [Collimonas arenae]|uniref:L-fucose mutarotase n=1 Tax=Collimonas arenae TaxID=279058 RepID=A0A0A1FHL6_9BURK|nr:L-rhamnose mutarotase [Collimonas arenae]AIY44076.1 L-fucose mutarotase [Collimonas arenae]